MAISSFFKSMIQTLKLTRKSDRQEFTLYLKLVLLGIAVVGVIGFIIQLVSAFLLLR